MISIYPLTDIEAAHCRKDAALRFFLDASESATPSAYDILVDAIEAQRDYYDAIYDLTAKIINTDRNMP